jgi:hypothetical protein
MNDRTHVYPLTLSVSTNQVKLDFKQNVYETGAASRRNVFTEELNFNQQ